MNDILKKLNKEQINLLKLKEFKKNDILFHENDLCEYVCLVYKGLISISSFSYNGKEIVYNVLKENDWFGNNLIFSDNPYYKGSVIALSNSKVFYISKSDLLILLKENSDFLESYLRVQSNFGKSLNSKIKLLGFDSAEERFFYYLFLNNNQIKFKNITSLAKELSLSRETVSRLIYRLISEKKIEKMQNVILFIK